MKRSQSQRHYDTYSVLRGRTIDIARKHIQFKSPYADILADYARMFESQEYKRIPAMYRDLLAEVRRCWFDRMHELELEWRLGPASGPVRTAIVDAWTDEMSELSRTPGALYGAHYWKNSDRLFGEWKATN